MDIQVNHKGGGKIHLSADDDKVGQCRLTPSRTWVVRSWFQRVKLATR